MDNDNNLDLLDLDDTDTMDTLPDAVPFAAPRPKKPWLLLGVGLAVIVLATYVIVSVISGDDSSSAIDVDLDVPAVVVDGAGAPLDMNVMPPVKTESVNVAVPQPGAQPAPQPVPQPGAQPAPQPVLQPEVQSAGVPVRVVEERKEVVFNPNAQQAKPAPKPVEKKPAPKPVVKPVTANWYVQLASYSTRALAESGQRQIQNAHKSLFAGQQFVILAAQMKDGTTKYRLRVAFNTSKEANGFCRNAKADGLDCYVTK